MTDVRLTALNPVDSQVYPVACNTSGELIVEQVDPGPDLTVTGDLTVDGSSTFGSGYKVRIRPFNGDGADQLWIEKTDGTKPFLVTGGGSGFFAGDITCTDSSNGFVLTSPNGTKYRLSVANDGTLSTSVV